MTSLTSLVFKPTTLLLTLLFWGTVVPVFVPRRKEELKAAREKRAKELKRGPGVSWSEKSTNVVKKNRVFWRYAIWTLQLATWDLHRFSCLFIQSLRAVSNLKCLRWPLWCKAFAAQWLSKLVQALRMNCSWLRHSNERRKHLLSTPEWLQYIYI